MTDDDGHCPVCVVIEVAGTAWDAYETYRTVTDSKSSTVEKVATVVGTAVGVFAPVGGYSTLLKGAVKQARREVTQQAVKRTDNAGDVAKPRGSNNPNTAEAAKEGRDQHKSFAEKVKDKPGWKSEPTVKNPETGRTLKPDALSPSGRPVELKPKTPSGISKGRRQLKTYENATGRKGRVVYYEPRWKKQGR